MSPPPWSAVTVNTILLSLVAGGGFALASLLGFARPALGHATRSLAVSVAAGILLAIAVGELLPEALESAGHEPAVYGFLLGFVALFSVEAITRGHTHHGADEDHVEHHSAWPFVIGLAVHNLADGFAIGTSSELSSEAGSAVALGVLVHQVPVGISLAAVLLVGHVTHHFRVRSAVGLALCIPIGALVVEAMPPLSEATLGLLLAAAAGALVYVSVGHLLPEAQREGRAPALTVLAFPAVLLATAWIFVSVLRHG